MTRAADEPPGRRPRRQWRTPRWLLFLSVFALIPLSSALLRTLFVAERELGEAAAIGFSSGVLWFAAGTGVSLMFCIAFRHSPRPYIIAHELTHALFGLLSLAKVSDLKLAKDGGSIRVSKDNMLILLSPYFFPFYAFCLLAVYALLSLAVPLAGTIASRVFVASVGAAWGYHFAWTINALLQRQNDLEEYGYVYSFNFILAANLLALCVFFVILTPMPTSRLCKIFRAETISVMGWFYDFNANIIRRILLSVRT